MQSKILILFILGSFLVIPVQAYTIGVTPGVSASYNVTDTSPYQLQSLSIRVVLINAFNVTINIYEVYPEVTYSKNISADISSVFIEYVIPANLKPGDVIPGTESKILSQSTEVVCGELRNVIYTKITITTNTSTIETEYKWDSATGILVWLKRKDGSYITEYSIKETNAWMPLILPGIIIGTVAAVVVIIILWVRKRKEIEY